MDLGWKCLACFFITNSCLSAAKPIQDAKPCNEELCKLPNCFCSGTKIPGGLSVQEVPQMVMISFDDSVNIQNFHLYKALFNDGLQARKNPNGCNITATFFVSHKYTDYQMVESLRHWRHEIADHTITHRTPISWWKNATYEEWKNEITGQREILRKFGHIEQETVKGFRAPYLQLGGNNQYKALWDSKFLYDSSIPTTQTQMWPYTFDYKSTQECNVKPPCPTDSFPGLWEIPMTDYTDKKGVKCSMIDECATPQSVSEAYDLLMNNFMRHYKANRSPFPMFMHAWWLSKYPVAFKAMGQFLNAILKMKDVYVINLSQVISWVRNPTPLSKINTFQPWQCNDAPPQPSCEKSTTCEYVVPPWGEHVNMKCCENECPKNYPWYGNPDGN